MTRNSCFARAFTLIEMAVVLAIIAIMMAFVYPAYIGMSVRAKATKDISNLRQLGIATQTYMNDKDGVFPGSAAGPTPVPWMSELNPKYVSAWRVLESPFDIRPTSEQGGANAMISYGINSNVYSGGAAISAEKITKPATFIVFAPAQKSGPAVSFQGVGNSSAPGVNLVAAGNVVTSSPGGVPAGGTHNSRTKINAMCADWHIETMAWSGSGPAFTHTTATGTDPDGANRWNP